MNGEAGGVRGQRMHTGSLHYWLSHGLIMNLDDPVGVVALLDQLKSSPAWQQVSNAPASVSSLLSQLSDTTHLTFQQSLPILSQLAEDSDFIAAFTKVPSFSLLTTPFSLYYTSDEKGSG